MYRVQSQFSFEMQSHNSVIEVKELTKVFAAGNVAVNSIDFAVMKNEVFGILGPNGSGKTTTLRMLTTILNPTSGDIKIEGQDYRANSQKIRLDIGYVPQKDALYGNLTCYENIDLFFAAYPYSDNRSSRIKEVLEQVNLWDVKNRLVKNLSGGMAKRLSIAAAIVHKPKVVFFDEITMGLDPVARNNIWSLIRKLKEHATVVMTTHYMDEAEELCDELIVMAEGTIIARGRPKEIIKKYQAKGLHEVITQISKEHDA